VEQRYQGEDYPGHDRKRFLVHERSSQFFIQVALRGCIKVLTKSKRRR